MWEFSSRYLCFQENLKDIIEGGGGDPKRSKALEAIRQQLEVLYRDDPNLLGIIKATLTELEPRSTAYLESLALVPKVPGEAGQPTPLQAAADAAWGRKTAPKEPPPPSRREQVLLGIESRRGLEDDSYLNEFRKLVNQQFANITGEEQEELYYSLVRSGAFGTLWDQAVGTVEGERQKARSQAFNTAYETNVMLPLKGSLGLFGPSLRSEADALVKRVGDARNGFRAEYEEWYWEQVDAAPDGRIRLDTVGPTAFLVENWEKVAGVISPSEKRGGIVRAEQEFSTMVREVVGSENDRAVIRANRQAALKTALDRYQDTLRKAATKKGLDPQAAAALRTAADAVQRNTAELVRDYKDVADIEDGLAYIARKLPVLIKSDLAAGETGLETAVVVGDMEGSVTGMIAFAGQGSATRKQEAAAANFEFMQTEIESLLESEGEKNSFELAVALEELKRLTANDLADLTNVQLNARWVQAVTRARAKFKLGPEFAARKAAERDAGIRQSATANGLDPDVVLAWAKGKDFGELTDLQVVQAYKSSPEGKAAAKGKEETAGLADKETALRNAHQVSGGKFDLNRALGILRGNPSLSAQQAIDQLGREVTAEGPGVGLARQQGKPAPGAAVGATGPGAPAGMDFRAWYFDPTATPEQQYLNAQKEAAARNYAGEHPDWSPRNIQDMVAKDFREQEIRAGIPLVVGGQQAAALDWARVNPTEEVGSVLRRFGGDGAAGLAARQAAQKETDLAWVQAVTRAFGKNPDLIARARNLKQDRPDLTSDEAIAQVGQEVGAERAAPILGSAVEGVSTTERAGGFNPNYQQAIQAMMAVPPGGAFAPIPVQKVQEAVLGPGGWAAYKAGQLPGVGDGRAQIGAAAQLLESGMQMEAPEGAGPLTEIKDPETLKRILDRLAKGLGDVEKMWGASAGRRTR